MEFRDSADRHGIDRDDVAHALRNAFRAIEKEGGVTMFVGPDYAGRLLEVGVVDRDGVVVVIHAMRARSQYL